MEDVSGTVARGYGRLSFDEDPTTTLAVRTISGSEKLEDLLLQVPRPGPHPVVRGQRDLSHPHSVSSLLGA